MSLSFVPLKTVSTVPQFMDLQNERMFEIYNSCKQVTRQVKTIQSVSSSGANQSCNPPSSNTIIYPLAYKKFRFTCTLNITSANANPPGGLYGFTNLSSSQVGKDVAHWVGIRSNPLDKIISTESVTLNGYNFSYKSSEFARVLERTEKYKKDEDIGHMTPTMLDSGHSYDDLFGTFNDPFGKFSDSNFVNTRNGFVGLDFSASDGTILVANTTQDLSFSFEVCEPIKCSPFYFQKSGITNVKSMDYSVVFENLNGMVCLGKVPGGITVNSISTVVSSGELLFSYYTPKLLNYYNTLKEISYDYSEFNVQKNDLGALTAGNDQKTAYLPSQNLSSVPKKIFIWIDKNKDKKTSLTDGAGIKWTDSLGCRINKISLNFGNQSGIFSSANEYQLYEMSVRNGYSRSFDHWYKYDGGLIILDLAKDFPLEEEGLAVSVLDNPLFSGSVDYVCLTSANYILYYCVEYNGVVSEINGVFSKQVSVITKNDVIESMQSPPQNILHDRRGGFNPLSLLSFLPPVVKAVRQGIKSDVGQSILKGADKGLESLGMGGKISGGKISGGKLITRNQLKKLM